MIATPGHTRPSWPRLVGIQFDLILRSGRWVELIGGAVALLIAGVLVTAPVNWMLLQRSASPVRVSVDNALPLWMLLLLAVASVWPILLWRGEPPGPRRDYWTLPVARGPHDLARVAAGGLWMLVVAVVVGIVRVASLPAASRIPLLIYCGFVLGLVTTYAVASIVAVVTARPARWLYGLLTAYALLLFGLPDRIGDVVGKPLSTFFDATGASALGVASTYQFEVNADSSLTLMKAWTDSISRANSSVARSATGTAVKAARPPAEMSASMASTLPSPPFFDRWNVLASVVWTGGAIAVLLFVSASRHER